MSDFNKNRVKLTFFDEYWLDFRRGTTRRWYTPEKYSIAPESMYCSLIYDTERKVYRLYYEMFPTIANEDLRYMMAVESTDMKNFTQVKNDEGGDILFTGGTGIHGTTVMYDEFEKDPERRYKLAGMFHMGDKYKGHESDMPVRLAFSPDGVHFTMHDELRATEHTSDSLNKLFYNPYTEEYGLLHRSAFVDRRASVRRSKDLVYWTEPEIALHPGSNYNDGFTQMQHYALSVKFFDGIFYGLLWRYNTCLYNMEYTKMFGYIEPELVYSYDGRVWLYTSGEVLMPRPEAPNPGCAGLAPGDMCGAPDDNYYYIACNAACYTHGTQANDRKLNALCKERGITAGTLMYRIRKDGFSGIESVGPGGEIVTKGIDILSDDLILNANASVGNIRYAIRHNDGTFVEGFGYEDCVPMEFEDNVHFKARFKEHSLKELTGQRVRLSIELNGAVLHCVTLDAAPYISQRQKSFSDPQGIFRK